MMGRRPGSLLRLDALLALRIVVLLPLFMYAAHGSAAAQPTSSNNRNADAGLVESALQRMRGETVYARSCAACHGEKGDGNGPSAFSLNPAPTDFTAGVFKFRSTPTGELPTVDDLARIIRNGVPRTMMPAWRDLLGEQELTDVAVYLTTLVEGYYEFEPADELHFPGEPSASEIVFAEGKYLYMILDCWTCHGARGTGDGPQAKTLKDDLGRKIKAFDFTRGRYKGGGDSRSIYRTFNTGMDGTPMPSYAGTFVFPGDGFDSFQEYRASYSEEEIQALKAYLLSQPTEAELETYSKEARDVLDARRKWSLVYFVKGLARPSGLLYDLFQHDYSVTQ